MSSSGVVALLRVHSMTDGKAALVEVSDDGTKVSGVTLLPVHACIPLSFRASLCALSSRLLNVPYQEGRE